MKTHALLSAQGRDRVGVADDLSAEVTRRRLRIEDGRMTALGGQFALIVKVGGEEEDLRQLGRELPRLRKNLGCEMQLGPIGPLPPLRKSPEYRIECFSQGPDAMNAVTGLLKRYGVNIEALEAQASATRWTSGLTFHLTARITLPPTCSRDRLRKDLRTLERERGLDIVISEAQPTPELTV